ncbi:MAG: SDR family NAD(P)-dependent oxidoreductase [Actinomycetota bacterium]|nr:SDR family NAD(P)-dependent oxidoreductase [Actinomycetota bacterium]
MDNSETGRPAAVITGASSGIGRATATALSADGWNLVLVARAEASLTAAAAQCSAAGADTLVLTADVGNQSEVDAVFDIASARFGRIDAVVHTAAAVGYGRFEDIPAEIFDRVITTNLLGTANVARAALQHFSRHGGGSLVLMGSLLGKIAVPFMSPYVTSKWGVHALARMLQIEARQTPGVRISLISPGSVNTPAYSQAANYLGRQGRPPPPVDPPEKVARAVLRVLRAPARDRSVGTANHVVVLGFRLLPAVFDVLVSPLMKIGGLSRTAIELTTGNVLHPHPAGDAEHGRWDRLGRSKGSVGRPLRRKP